jgi:hypothetical protein
MYFFTKYVRSEQLERVKFRGYSPWSHIWRGWAELRNKPINHLKLYCHAMFNRNRHTMKYCHFACHFVMSDCIAASGSLVLKVQTIILSDDPSSMFPTLMNGRHGQWEEILKTIGTNSSESTFQLCTPLCRCEAWKTPALFLIHDKQTITETSDGERDYWRERGQRK